MSTCVCGFYEARLLQDLDPVDTPTESEYQQPNQQHPVSADDSDMQVHDLDEEIEGMRVHTVRVPIKPSQSEKGRPRGNPLAVQKLAPSTVYEGEDRAVPSPVAARVNPTFQSSQ